MAIPTVFVIKHKCGHTEERDLSDRPAGKRKGFASWLSAQICSRCYRKEGAEEYKKMLYQAALENQQQLDLPALEGTEKQVPWATTARNELLMNAFEQLVRGADAQMDEDQFEATYLAPARLITSARWWIDYKDTEVEDLLECLTTAVDESEDINENPF
ncbi:hypothetical protein E4U03_07670 [Rothia nasimurium]|uniref:Uncharacterized protein n=1 Tax=Rothia nasimurium TaxID=85336 RepID=A0A4Y9F452_9MICC|nr:hypothetical protein [Rothia nasimurium]MBF0808486.1 hypothetical protein [Rothia nasimurium]TFU21880.1 hypothetical protein E4U03_07670 [Rothia nasimurium]